MVKIFTTVVFLTAPLLFSKPILSHSMSFITSLCLLFLSLCLKCPSVIPPSIYRVSFFPFSVCHSFFPPSSLPCLSSSFPLVRLKGADKWMDRWIPRSAEGQKEWWSDEIKEWRCVTALSWARFRAWEGAEEKKRKKNTDKKEKNEERDSGGERILMPFIL